MMGLGEMATATTSLTDESLQLVGGELGYEVEVIGVDEEIVELESQEVVDESKLEPRPPVVTVMGHVDHGKTRCWTRSARPTSSPGEFGGITQHIGAYQVHTNDREITFIDTPGHEAFTAMRARGAQVTDIVVLVVAADDGVMPQTVEAIDHAKAAGVPIVIAVNKIDKPEADPQRARQQLVERGVVPVEWGGDYEFVDVSAKEGTNIDTLLETVLIVADLAESASGAARPVTRRRHRGQSRQGPRHRSRPCSCSGGRSSRRRAHRGHGVRARSARCSTSTGGASSAGPASPSGSSGGRACHRRRRLPSRSPTSARPATSPRSASPGARGGARSTTRPPSLADLMARPPTGGPELNLVIKADVQGSLGALTNAFLKLPTTRSGSGSCTARRGAITEKDVTLALASGAIVVGFNVRPDANARELAEKEGSTSACIT